MAQLLSNFLDEEGKLKIWPAKRAMQKKALRYFAEKFEADAQYTEQDVNIMLGAWHVFGDYTMLRRAMVDEGFLCRTPDGRRYWKNPVQPPEEEA